jgi:hypothetical protein
MKLIIENSVLWRIFGPKSVLLQVLGYGPDDRGFEFRKGVGIFSPPHPG